MNFKTAGFYDYLRVLFDFLANLLVNQVIKLMI